MLRLNLFSWNNGTRLLAAFALAVFIPTVAFALFTFFEANNVNQQNLEAYLSETSVRRQQAILASFDRAQEYISAFVTLDNNHRTLYDAFVFRNTVGAIDPLRQELLGKSENLLDSAWLMNRRGTVIADATAEGKLLPFTNPDQSRSQAFGAGQTMEDRGRTQELVVAETDSGIQLEIITTIIDDNENLLGYLVVALNVNTVIYAHLNDNAGLSAYSFVVLPANNAYLAPPNVRSNNLVDLNSLGVNRARGNANSSLQIYSVGTGDERREVLGYHTRLIALDNNFILMTELNRSIIAGQIGDYVRLISFPLILGSVGLVLVLTLLLNYVISTPIQELGIAVQGMLRGVFDIPIRAVRRNDEFGGLAKAFVDMRQQVNTFTTETQKRLRDRDRDVRVTQDISRALTGERDLQALMNKVVALIIENFPAIYHAQIFLVDSKSYAVLRASTGDAGKALLARGHRLQVGSVSVIGQVVEQGETLVARDIAASEVHRRNEFLPDTHAELAIPLKIESTIIGALDVQSKERDVFDEDLVNVLTTLAGQITIAIENVRLYEESQRRLAAIEEDRRAVTRRDWQAYLNASRRSGLTQQAGNLTDFDFTELRRAAVTSAKPIVGGVTDRNTVPFVVPIQLRGEVLGAVDYEIPEKDFRYDKVLLAEELVNRLAVSLDNARLFQESQRAAERERIVNTISTKLTGQTDIQDIIQTALQEIGLALRTPQVALRLTLGEVLEPDSADNSSHAGNGSYTNGTHRNGNLSADNAEPDESSEQ